MRDYLSSAREVMLTEARGIQTVAESLDGAFIDVIDGILNCQGRVVMTGVGKSGIIAKKIAATMSSTGTPSFFMHPSEAAHGDLGMVTKEDIVFMISNSGESDELLYLISSLKRMQCRIFLMTTRRDSSLASVSNVVLLCAALEEADLYGLAPTVSTTAMLAVGDAIAMVLLQLRGFNKDNFALFHPAGSLGKRLIIKVEDLMKKGSDIPIVTPEITVRQAIFEISSKGMGATVVVSSPEKGDILGIITDGDIRRIVQYNSEIWDLCVKEVMTVKPTSIQQDALAIEALNIMEQKRITVLPVTDSMNKMVGLIHMHHILNIGVV